MTRLRALLLLCFTTATLALAPLAQGVIGGTALQVQNAPWAVFVRQTVSGGTFQCSGSIVDSLHVLTAAHCVFDQSGHEASITALSVRAGISNYVSPASSDAEQARAVSSLRVHPGYAWSSGTSADDVALLALSAPLDLSGPAVQPIALPRTGASFPAETSVELAGFGRELASAQPTGALTLLAATTDTQESCGGFSNTVIPDADAVALCASAPGTAICTGDSGAGLVTSTGTPTLIGVASAGRPGCDVGTSGVFTYVGAPEILRFIQGDDAPPVAPRKTTATTIELSWRGALAAGNSVECSSAGWSGSPTFAFAFVDAASGQVLQQGAGSTYVLHAADVGKSIFCRALATNDGGTAALRTQDTSPIGAAAPVAISAPGPFVGARGRSLKVQVILRGGAGLGGVFKVCVTPPARVGGRVCSSQRVSSGNDAFFTLGFRVRPTAPTGAARLAISAVAGVSRATATAVARITG